MADWFCDVFLSEKWVKVNKYKREVNKHRVKIIYIKILKLHNGYTLLLAWLFCPRGVKNELFIPVLSDAGLDLWDMYCLSWVQCYLSHAPSSVPLFVTISETSEKIFLPPLLWNAVLQPTRM